MDNEIRKSPDFRVDSAIPIVDLLIQLGDETILSHLHELEKDKNKDINKNEKKRTIVHQKVEGSASYVSDIDDNIDLRMFSVLSEDQLESLKLILKLLNTRQLKALQFASRYVHADICLNHRNFHSIYNVYIFVNHYF